ncbi:DGQHR domain-containing protein DpdB [Rhodospirillales bacterium]|nr:DGQHR domain-containing protein DpdB [Rhodospirillales bacterium]
MDQQMKFSAIRAKQSKDHSVVSFPARASEILEIASIDRISRDQDGKIKGFQRPQIALHINEIRDYLSQDDAVLPNPIVLAFTEAVEVTEIDGKLVEFTIDISKGAPGLVVDGQQRLTALSGIPGKDFEVFVSALICKDEEELRKQFILINNTKPLPKSLIYELLPEVGGLPERLSSRSLAAKLIEMLNYQEGSALKGQINQHTNPDGVLGDYSIQKLIMNSLSDGACREMMSDDDGMEKCLSLVSEFFFAVQQTFPEAWHDHTVKTSRLLHGAGLISMGYVMEFLYFRDNAKTRGDFLNGLKPFEGRLPWTKGEWVFEENETRPWNSIQNLNRDIQLLASYLTRELKRHSNQKIVPLQTA